jgi:hypothetical protein
MRLHTANRRARRIEVNKGSITWVKWSANTRRGYNVYRRSHPRPHDVRCKNCGSICDRVWVEPSGWCDGCVAGT